MPTARRTPARLSLTLGLLGLVPATVALGGAAVGSTTPAAAASTTLPSNTGAGAKYVPVPGKIIAITRPLANGTLWALVGARGKRAVYQYNANTGTYVGAELVSPNADTVALSPSGATLALGTTGGAYPAVVWYSAQTGRFANASRSPAPVTLVATNTAGTGIFAVRAPKTGTESVFAFGTFNGLGYSFAVPGTTVGLAPTPDQKRLLVLQSNGQLGSVGVPVGTYIPGVSTGAPALGMALSADGATLFVLRGPVGHNAVAEVDVATGRVIETIPVSGNCVSIALSTDGHTLYEALRGKNASSIRPVTVP